MHRSRWTLALASLALFLAGAPALAQAQPAPPEPPPPGPAYPPPPGYAPYPQGYPPPGYAPPGSPPPVYYPGYPPPGYAPPGYGPPGYSPYAPPPEEPRSSPRGVHLHDGFYLRVGLGAAVHRSTLTLPGVPSAYASTDLKGTGVALDIAIGAAVVPGFIVAGDLGGHAVSSPSASTGTASALAFTQVTYTRVGLLLDWYIWPAEGFHIQAGGALASYAIQTDFGAAFSQFGTTATSTSFSGTTTLTGFGWNLGIGYEGWVSNQWGIGGLIRLDGASVAKDGAEAKVLAPGFLVTGTFN